MFNNPLYYNNPYSFQNYNVNPAGRKGLFSSIGNHSKINWTNLLNNTQKTLNVINQAIPVYYQIKPIYNNARTMLRMVSALKDTDTSDTPIQNENNQKEKNTSDSGPVFFT